MPDCRPCDLVPPGQTTLACEPAIHLSALADQPDRLAAIPLPGRSPGAPGGAVAAATLEPRPAGRAAPVHRYPFPHAGFLQCHSRLLYTSPRPQVRYLSLSVP